MFAFIIVVLEANSNGESLSLSLFFFSSKTAPLMCIQGPHTKIKGKSENVPAKQFYALLTAPVPAWRPLVPPWSICESAIDVPCSSQLKFPDTLLVPSDSCCAKSIAVYENGIKNKWAESRFISHVALTVSFAKL